MQDHSYAELSSKIVSLLNLPTSPLAITFSDVTPQNAPAFKDKMSEPTSDGRTGRVPAGCVFWMKAAERTFSTAPEDHGNCSVGESHPWPQNARRSSQSIRRVCTGRS